MRASKASRSEGFTLVEVLVALTIFSIGIMALFHLRGESVRRISALEDRALAHIVAENRIIESLYLGPPPIVGVERGVTDLGERSWEWSEEIIPTPDAELRRIEVTVRLQNGDDVLADIVAFSGTN